MNPRLAMVLALAAAACGPKVSKEKPAAADPAYVFPHSTHVDADVDCKACHPMDKATKLEAGVRHVKVPANVTKIQPCADCHDKDFPAFKPPARHAPFRLRFDHAAHLPRVKGDCKRCHTAPPEQGDKQAKAPPMGACTACHEHQQDFAEARCVPCHVDLKGYQPETAFKHEGEWLRAHGALARPSGESCAACHDQTYCAECHSPQTAAGRPSIVFPERVERAYIHRGDYVSRHMIDAGANPASCRRCHGSAFCESCHELQGLSKLSPATGETNANLRRPRSHDQDDWATPGTPGALPRHGPAARRDIASCAGCHDQGAQATCVGCHRVGSPVAGTRSPHPKKFLSAHDRGDISKNEMCRVCHG
ncbi:MAG TPA: cytochrome c3 family protein [Anaeromyxobacter sp.]|nr:cytochrome c3 family protein [Anaeromyxobacter sp.]